MPEQERDKQATPPCEWIDTHVHLDSEAYAADWQAVLDRAEQAGVGRVLAPATQLESARRLLQMRRSDPRLAVAVGIHPHDAASYRPHESPAELRALAAEAVAIGEIGLDFHYDFVQPEAQIQCLRAQLELADQLGLPVILHCREAGQALWQELRRFSGLTGVVHCFSEPWEWGERFLELGFYLGITGMVTFPRLSDVHEAARRIPSERLLLETDGPYLAPIPHRGKRNEPAWVPVLAARVAQLRDVAQESLARATTGNAQRLFSRLCEERRAEVRPG